jgi:hypothetical protein
MAMHGAFADDGVDITDPGQVAALSHKQDQIDLISSAIMQCMDAGKTHPACMCLHEAIITDFNSSVTELFLNHPVLKDHDLVSFKATDGMWISQSLEGIQRQAGTAPSCP